MRELQFLESSDVARELGVSAAMVRVLVVGGRLVPAARTRRGVALFDAHDVEHLRVQRERRRARVAVTS